MQRNLSAQSVYPISRYLNVRSAYFPCFTSDGQRLVFLSDITGLPQVWQVDLAGQPGAVPWPDQLSFTADRVSGVWAAPGTSGQRLIYAQDSGGNENSQLLLLAGDGTADRLLTSGYEAVMHVFGDWSANGTQLLYAANRRSPQLFDLYLQPLDGEPRLVWQNQQPGFLRGMRLSPDGRRAVLTREASSFDHELLEIDLQTGAARSLVPAGVQARYHNPCYAADGRSLYLTTDLDDDFLVLVRLDLDSLAVERLVAPGWDVECLTCAPDGRHLAYAVNVDGLSRLELLDLSSGAVRRPPEGVLPAGVIGMYEEQLAFTPDSRRLAFSLSGATRNMNIYLWDLASDQLAPLTRCGLGGLPADSLDAPELVHYPSFDRDERGEQRQIPAWFYRPAQAATERVPAILVVHGGPESQFQPYFHFMIQYFLHHGYAVLAPNVRGSTGYGKAYSQLDDVERRMDSVADLAQAAHWLRRQPGIDGQRLVVYGGSYGGFMVLAALTNYPELWAAGVDIVGISNFITFLERTSHYRRAHREAEYGSLERDRAFLERISPLQQVERIQVPLMVIHGANDPRVPLNEAQQLVEALERRGVPVELLVFDDEGHGIVKLKNKLLAYPSVVDFLNRHVGPGAAGP